MQTKNSISDARRRLIERIADSSLFQKPSRLRDLFLYICDYSLQGRHEELREQRIGEVVFGRGHDFRPNDDTIVRVEVRKLRQRLEDYFAAEGKDEPILISIPKGAYIASFEARTPAAALPEVASEGRPGQADFSEVNSDRKVQRVFRLGGDSRRDDRAFRRTGRLVFRARPAEAPRASSRRSSLCSEEPALGRAV